MLKGIRSLSKYPKVLIIIGVLWLMPGAFLVIKAGFSIYSIFAALFGLFLPLVLINVGVVGLKGNMKTKV